MAHIAKMGLFSTPNSSKDIEAWINLHPQEDRLTLFTAMGMTWNFLAELSNKDIGWLRDPAPVIPGADLPTEYLFVFMNDKGEKHSIPVEAENYDDAKRYCEAQDEGVLIVNSYIRIK